MDAHVGHESQVSGVEEHRLVGGRGDGMRLLEVTNGKGLELTVSLDRCADIARLRFRGINMGYFSPNGYVAPAYYDDKGTGFLKSFTAGFLTTCGLTAVGTPCTDAGEELPLHGTIDNTPAESVRWERTADALMVSALMNDEHIFGHKLVLRREVSVSTVRNEFAVRDVIENRGDSVCPAMILYHMNMGYPLLSEDAELFIPSTSVAPRTEHAREGLTDWAQVPAPTPGFEEQCYFHDFSGRANGLAAIYNPAIGQGLAISFDPTSLPFFTQWKMAGVRDYVMGLEPGNCHPDGRDKMRAEGRLVELEPGASVEYQVRVSMIPDADAWERLRKSA